MDFELKVYRCLFKIDDESKPIKVRKGGRKKTYSLVPDVKTLKLVKPHKVWGYVVDTHDQAENRDGQAGNTPEYYVIVFSIEAEDLNGWSLHLVGGQTDDETMVSLQKCDNVPGVPGGQLWYVEAKKVIEETNKGEIKSHVNSSLKSTHTAGVLTLEVRHDTEGSQRIEIKVQPSIFAFDEYEFMLRRMAATHDKLLLSTRRWIGTGAEESQDELRPGTPEYDLSLWKRMKPAVLRIMEMPATSLKRDRRNLPLHKIRHFDQRTMQGLATNPGEGKVSGIAYRDDHDTLENRTIKAILIRCSHNVLNYKTVHSLSDKEINSEIERQWEKSSKNTDFESFRKRRLSLYRLATDQQKQKEMRQASVELRQILETPWFKAITDVDSVDLPNTPLFLHNPLYREVYNCAHSFLGAHPSCTFFNPYVFGTNSLSAIYEYWVLYELLNRLLNLGFRPKEGQLDACESLLRQSIVGNQKKPEGIKILLTRRIPVLSDTRKGKDEEAGGKTADIEVELGFNCHIGAGNEHLDPDYYLRVKQTYREMQTDHWYFLDAKCMTYKDREELWASGDSNLADKTIRDVCYVKYLNKMMNEELLQKYLSAKEGEQGTSAEIRGAYLLVAEVRNDGQSSEGASDPFFGAPQHLPQHLPEDLDDYKGKYADDRVNREHPEVGYPTHWYGAAVVHPSQYLGEDGKPAELTGADELTALLKLIFEYREGPGLFDPPPYDKHVADGHVEEQKDGIEERDDAFEVIHPPTDIQRRGAMGELPPTLFGCWNSAVRHPVIQEPLTFDEQKTRGGNSKYYVTCPYCGDMRVQSFCANKQCRREIYKYDVGNYHCPIPGVKKWGFVCPHCGDGLQDR